MVSKLKVALVLVIIGAISGFLIWGTNELTYEGILANRAAREESYYKKIFSIEDSVSITISETELEDNLIEVVIEDDSDNVLGYIYKQSDINAYGGITLMDKYYIHY